MKRGHKFKAEPCSIQQKRTAWHHGRRSYLAEDLRADLWAFGAHPKSSPDCDSADDSIRLRRMEKNRLEAFSDGVIAIIITVMVLELKVPHSSDLAALKPLLPE